MSQSIYNGQIVRVSLQTGQKLTAVAVSGTYSILILSGTGSGTSLATNAKGGDYGPYAYPLVVQITSSAASEIDYDFGVSTLIESDTVAKLKADPLTGGITFSAGNVAYYAGTSLGTLVINDVTAAAANTAAIQAALTLGGAVSIGIYGVVYISSTLIYGDNTTIQLSPLTAVKMVSGLRVPLLKSAALGRMTGSPVSVALTWASGMTFSVAWSAHGRAVGDPVWLDGSTLQPQYKGVFVVESVTDAGNFVVRARRLPTAVPTGAVVAVAATKNTIISGGIWDYSYDTTMATGLNPMGFVNIGTYKVFVRGLTINQCAKYLLYWSATLNCGHSDLWCDETNSDGVKVYGPAIGYRGDGIRGAIKDDGCSFQTKEPSAYIQYQPYFGDVIDCEVKNIAVKSTTSQAVFYTGSLATGYMDECRFVNVAGVSPSGIRAVNNMTAVDAVALDYSAGALWVDGLAGDYVTPVSLEQIQLQRWGLRNFRASTSRVVPQDQINVNVNFYARDAVFDLGSFDSPSITGGGGFCINFNGGADLLAVMCGAKSYGGQPRVIQLSSASSVKELLIEKSNSDCDQIVECFAPNSPTIIVRNSRVGGAALLSARTDCTLVLEGNDITNASNGVVRGNATCTVTLRTDGCNRLRAGLWAVQAAGTLTVLAYGNDIAIDPIASTFLSNTAGQFLTSSRAGAVNQGPAVRVAAGWVALGTGASQVNTLIA